MSSRSIALLKIIFAFILVPVIMGVSAGLGFQLVAAGLGVAKNFFLGICAFLFLYLFVYEPCVVYRGGQRVVEVLFRFFSPLVKAAPFCLPIFTILIVFIFLGIALITKQPGSGSLFIFLIGFSLMFHLVFTAKALRAKNADYLHANYFFFIELIYFLNIFLVAFAFNYMVKGFSFIDFYQRTLSVAGNMYTALVAQLFLVRN